MADNGIRDTQKNALYKWERAIFGGSHDAQNADAMQLTMDELQEAGQAVLERYGVNGTLVVEHRKANAAACYNSHRFNPTISMPGWARTPAVLLHEIAHAIIARKTNDAFANHGAEFAALVIELYKTYIDGFDSKAARKAANDQRPRRVVFASRSKIPQPVNRKGIAKVKAIFAIGEERRVKGDVKIDLGRLAPKPKRTRTQPRKINLARKYQTTTPDEVRLEADGSIYCYVWWSGHARSVNCAYPEPRGVVDALGRVIYIECWECNFVAIPDEPFYPPRAEERFDKELAEHREVMSEVAVEEAEIDAEWGRIENIEGRIAKWSCPKDGCGRAASGIHYDVYRARRRHALGTERDERLVHPVRE